MIFVTFAMQILILIFFALGFGGECEEGASCLKGNAAGVLRCMFYRIGALECSAVSPAQLFAIRG